MKLFQTVAVYDGPMETRIEYGTDLKLDKEMSIFALCDSAEGRAALTDLYRRDIEAAQTHGVTIVVNAPTYRASREHARRMGYTAPDAVAQINANCLELVGQIRDSFAAFRDNIVITAPLGPKHAGYHPGLEFDLASAREYHAEQAQCLASLPVDYVSIAAMPGAIEAQGAALAVAEAGLPYTVGFILGPDANLLDGSKPEQLIADIDSQAPVPPLFYVIGCTHATVCADLLARGGPQLARIQAVKANGSNLTAAELLALDHAAADGPDQFARDLWELGKGRQFKIYGGCCGTDTAHLQSLCQILSKS